MQRWKWILSNFAKGTSVSIDDFDLIILIVACPLPTPVVGCNWFLPSLWLCCCIRGGMDKDYLSLGATIFSVREADLEGRDEKRDKKYNTVHKECREMAFQIWQSPRERALEYLECKLCRVLIPANRAKRH